MGDSFRTKKATGPAVEVDCAGWVDTSAGDWSRGRFVTRKATGPAVEVDCSGWRAERLELVVAVADGVTGEMIRAFTGRVVSLIAAIDPALQLAYDPPGTSAEVGSVRVVLTPTTPAADIGRRLETVVRVVNGSLAAALVNAPDFQLRKAA